MDIDLRRLQILLSVDRAGGVLAAADNLRLTASAISQQIARLEAETGVQLLDRLPRGAVVTPAGRLLVELAERIENETIVTVKDLLRLEGGIQGIVAIGAFQTSLRNLLIPLLPTLNEVLPGVEIKLHEVSEDPGNKALRSGDLDLLLMERDATAAGPISRGVKDVPLFSEPWLLVTPESEREPKSLAELNGRTWLVPNAENAASRAMNRLCEDYQIAAPTGHSYLDYGVAAEMVAAGLGITILPWLALHPLLPAGIQAFPLAGLGTRSLVIRHRANRKEPSPATNAVIELLINRANELHIG